MAGVDRCTHAARDAGDAAALGRRAGRFASDIRLGESIERIDYDLRGVTVFTTTGKRHPGAGSSRYARVLPADGLRMWPVAGSAYRIFHLERADHIDIVRVLHGARDIPVLLRDVT